MPPERNPEHPNLTKKRKKQPYELFAWSVPSGLKIPKDKLKLRLDFFEHQAMATVYREDSAATKVVSPTEVARVLSRLMGASTGVLPPETVWWTLTKEGAELGVYQPPKAWRVALMLKAGEPARRFTLPMPGLVFCCRPGHAPRIYAAKRRPLKRSDMLYRAPCFNVFEDGGVCQGSHRFPDRPEEVAESFFKSFFAPTGDSDRRSKKHPKFLGDLWAELDGKAEYPLEDLIEHGTLEKVMKGGSVQWDN